MTAAIPPVIKPRQPLSAHDQLAPGARATPKLDFATEMKPFLSPDVTGAHGQHVVRKDQGTPKPLNNFDSIPGVHLKGVPQPMRSIAPADYVAGSRTHQKDQDVESQARKWVSQTFFGTLLKQMHDSPFKSEMFSGGRGAKAFEPLMDQHLADHMARGSGKKLVNAIAKQLKNKAVKAYQAQAKPGDEANAFDDLNGSGSLPESSPARDDHGGTPPVTAPNSYPKAKGYVPTRVRG